MAEVLVDAFGSVIDVVPDGHPWSLAERSHEGWRIQVMFGPVEHYQRFAQPDMMGRRSYRLEGDKFVIVEYPEDAADRAAWAAAYPGIGGVKP